MNARIITTILVAALALVSFAIAAPVAPLGITEGDSSGRDLSGIPDQSVSAVAGNVSHINITALGITQSWQGYYGNVSGVITLDDGDNNTFYNWTIASAAGEVYATRDSGVDFTTIECTNATNIAAEESTLGQSATDTDSVTNTFTGTTHPTFDVGAVTIGVDTCPATNAFGSTGAQSSDFFQVLLSDENEVTVYTTILGAAAGFNGQTWDFELLVGEDGHGNTATTTYFFYVELS